MKALMIFGGVIAYLAIGYVIATYMGGDRSKLSPDVTYLDWLGFLLIVFLWPLLPVGFFIAFLRWMAGGSH